MTCSNNLKELGETKSYKAVTAIDRGFLNHVADKPDVGKDLHQTLNDWMNLIWPSQKLQKKLISIDT